MNKQNEDILIIEAILSEKPIIKSAQFSGLSLGSLVESMKNYYKSNENPNDKLGSVVNLLVPGILWASGFPMLAIIANVATRWFGFDLEKIFKSIASEITSLIRGGGTATSSWVENTVKEAVASGSNHQFTQEDLNRAQNIKVSSINETIAYRSTILQLIEKSAQRSFFGNLLRFTGLSYTTSNLLVKIIKWIVIALLASAGFLAVDDAAHSIMQQVTGPQENAGPSTDSDEPSTDLKISTQTILPVNPNYTEERLNISSHWIETVPPDQIGNQIIQWAKEIYPGLNDADNIIESSNGFHNVVNYILNYNRTNTSDITFIPKDFTSRKQVVDQFIDEIAQKVKSESKSETIPLAQPNKPNQSGMI